MNTHISDLLALQTILRRGDAASTHDKAQATRLEKKIPAPLLAHFLRLRACDRRGVALVRNGVCGECHLRLPSAMLDNLKRTDDVQLCENCGCYLALVEEEAAAVAVDPPPGPAPAMKRRGRRKLVATAV